MLETAGARLVASFPRVEVAQVRPHLVSVPLDHGKYLVPQGVIVRLPVQPLGALRQDRHQVQSRSCFRVVLDDDSADDAEPTIVAEALIDVDVQHP